MERKENSGKNRTKIVKGKQGNDEGNRKHQTKWERENDENKT